jgi:hypothetical protein
MKAPTDNFAAKTFSEIQKSFLICFHLFCSLFLAIAHGASSLCEVRFRGRQTRQLATHLRHWRLCPHVDHGSQSLLAHTRDGTAVGHIGKVSAHAAAHLHERNEDRCKIYFILSTILKIIQDLLLYYQPYCLADFVDEELPAREGAANMSGKGINWLSKTVLIASLHTLQLNFVLIHEL